MIKITSSNEYQTKKIAYLIAKALQGEKILALSGPLGTGKTTFIRGLAQAFKLKKITSPTFLLLAHHKTGRKKPRFFYHFDFYRLKNPQDLLELGFWEILQEKNRVVAIEWPEKVLKILPQETLYLKFAFGKARKERIIKIWQKKSS